MKAFHLGADQPLATIVRMGANRLHLSHLQGDLFIAALPRHQADGGDDLAVLGILLVKPSMDTDAEPVKGFLRSSQRKHELPRGLQIIILLDVNTTVSRLLEMETVAFMASEPSLRPGRSLLLTRVR